MKKNILLYILLAFLIVMNGFFLFNQFGSSEVKRSQKKGPGDFIAKQLNFDENQTKQFEKLDALHHEKTKAILDDMKISKDALFDQIAKETLSKIEIDSLVAVISKKQAVRELETFIFFRSVSALCDGDQRVRFNSILKDAVGGPPEGVGPPRRDGKKGSENRPPPPPRH